MDITSTAFVDAVSKISKDSSMKKTVDSSGVDFGDVLTNAIDQVNSAQLESEEMDRLMAIGEVENLHDVTIAAQKAELTLSLAVEVKNRLVEAYQEIMRVNL